MSTLREVVQEWKEDREEEGYPEAIADLLQHGCQSGTVSKLCYYSDTVRFYEEHQEEISALLAEFMEEYGFSLAEMFGDKWDEHDPLALGTYNRNLLAWFAFEETARTIAEEEEEREEGNQ